MITYEKGGINYVTKIFKMKGSVFPQSLLIAIPSAILTAAIRYFIQEDFFFEFWAESDSILKESQTWTGFSFLVGFFIVFRTNMAYGRFWDGNITIHIMRAEWFDACSALVSFCRHSKVDAKEVLKFKQILVRLFSMLHAAALADIEDCGEHTSVTKNKNQAEHRAFTFDLLDAEGIDDRSLLAIRDSNCKTELIFEWIQMLIVDSMDSGVLSIPPPILSRAFQELANGMVQYHEATTISRIPFPFPYAQTCDFLVVVHTMILPFILATWCAHWLWAGLFCFISVFVFWSLNFIAVEIENPFGTDSNDIDCQFYQKEMNEQLLLLISPEAMHTPTLSAGYRKDPGKMMDKSISRDSFVDAWSHIKLHKNVRSITKQSTSQESPSARRQKVLANELLNHSTTSSEADLESRHSERFSETESEVTPRKKKSKGSKEETCKDSGGKTVSPRDSVNSDISLENLGSHDLAREYDGTDAFSDNGNSLVEHGSPTINSVDDNYVVRTMKQRTRLDDHVSVVPTPIGWMETGAC